MSAFKALKDKLYDILVCRNPQIMVLYQDYVNADISRHQRHRLRSWLYLLKLNISRKSTILTKVKPYCGGSESGILKQCLPSKLVTEMLKYDIISFDIFDTLIFRPFEKPSDLFHILSYRHHYLDFCTIRREMEQRARSLAQNHEATLAEIYQAIQKYVGIPSAQGIAAEEEAELEFSYANPYMLEVFTRLIAKNKRIILVSDTYFESEFAVKLLHKCGYNGYEKLFLSCEHRKSKHTGELYDEVKRYIGKKTIIHIGDNYYSDYIVPKSKGFHDRDKYDIIKYHNVNSIGKDFRAENMSDIIGSCYKGLVNANLHNGLNLFTKQYEYGYGYGGLLVLGFCRFIHEYTVRNNIEKVLFLSRDGEIVKKAYSILYPNNYSEYVYWSRRFALKLVAGRYRYEYIRRFVTHRIDSGITVGDALITMELEHLKLGIQSGLPLTKGNADRLTNCLYNNWGNVTNAYEEQVNAAKSYFLSILSGCSSACVVDVGFMGSGVNMMSYAVNQMFNIPCRLIGIVACANASSCPQVQYGELVSYMYSPMDNRQLMKEHNPSANHNLYLEMLFTSIEPKFKGYYRDSLKFCNTVPQNEYAIVQIQQGILDFVKQYCTHFQKYSCLMDIQGSDAYAPFKFALKNDSEYLKYVLSDCVFDPFI